MTEVQRRKYTGSMLRPGGGDGVVEVETRPVEGDPVLIEEVMFEKLTRVQEMTPTAKAQLRAEHLRRLHPAGQTRCDKCERDVDTDEALETWRGGVCVYVVCDGCLNGRELSFVKRPDGIQVLVRESDEVVETIRPVTKYRTG